MAAFQHKKNFGQHFLNNETIAADIVDQFFSKCHTKQILEIGPGEGVLTKYLLKNTEPNNLLQAISEVYSGGAPMNPGIARKVLQQFQTILAEEKKDYHLSGREKEVLGLLVAGLSYKMIAGDLKITYDTVRAHMKKIYEKLHVASMTEAVAKAINQKLFSDK